MATGFISGFTSQPWVGWPIPKGDVLTFAAYATGGDDDMELRVDNLRLEKYYTPTGYEWRVLFDVTNLGGERVPYELWLAQA